MSKRLPLADELVFRPDGTVVGWACALNDYLDAKIPLRECAAPRYQCPRGYTEAFECRREGPDGKG